MAKVFERAAAWTTRQIQKRAPYSAENAYLEGPFSPVSVESTVTDLHVTGELPRELSGMYARIGPNPIGVINPALHHWFVGDGMVHGIRMDDGQAKWYRNRYIGSSKATKMLGKPDVPGIRNSITDSPNTNVVRQGGRIWAIVEAGGHPVELDSDLESVRHSFFQSELKHSFSAHPHEDPITRELHAVCYDALNPNKVAHVVVDADCKVTRIEDIPVKDGPMIHDCAITKNNVLILDLPVTFSGRDFLSGSSFPYRWNEAHAARVGLLPRTGSAKDIRWFDVDPCYVFHTANAFEREDGVTIVDVVVHPTMFAESRQGVDSKSTTFERWTLDPKTTRVSRTVLSDMAQEFPRYDERLSMQPYRYAYAAGFKPGTRHEGLVKHDVLGGTSSVHDFGSACIAGEPVFVPRTAQSAEDDGWLVTFVYDKARDASDFVVLNAGDFEGPPQATIQLPVRVPLGFHGNWMPD